MYIHFSKKSLNGPFFPWDIFSLVAGKNIINVINYNLFKLHVKMSEVKKSLYVIGYSASLSIFNCTLTTSVTLERLTQ